MTSTPSAEETAVSPADGEPGGSRPTRRQPKVGGPAAPSGGSAQGQPPTSSSAPTRTSSTPAAAAPRRVLGYGRQRYEARKVRRLIRHLDPWSMLKLSLLVSLCMWLIVMIASVILWTVASNAGTIESFEEVVNSSLSLQDWTLDGDFIFRQFGLITLLLSLGFTAAVVIATLVFNLISDIIGGVWVSVIEEETARPVSESKRDRSVG
ncbi:MAG: DUF3566 domain-containing protein [Actinomycetota bacterium]|nr:DUF3566 domain-containing protein [Actinomycetota bacterium]